MLSCKSSARIALGIVCNLPSDETANDSEQTVRCLVVAQKPVIFIDRVPVSTIVVAARVKNLVAQKGGSNTDGGAGDGRVEVVVAAEEPGARVVGYSLWSSKR